MKILVNFADERMTRSQLVCTKAAYENGVDKVFEYTKADISKSFWEFNYDVLKHERGAGYWLWKPYVIQKALYHCNDGDILIYMDAGVKLITDVQHIVEAMDQDLFLFSNGHQHVHWCKADVYEAILPRNHSGQDSSVYDYRDQTQVQASVIFIRVSDFTRKFIKEWLLWCQMPGFIDDSPSVSSNHPEFAEHRHDQAVLTCLSKKYGIKLHWWADKLWYESQRHRWPGDKYPSMWEHHRKRNNEW